jgi:hypothetical protein
MSKKYTGPFRRMQRRQGGSGEPDFLRIIRGISNNTNYLASNAGFEGQHNRQQWQASGSVTGHYNFGSSSYIYTFVQVEFPIAKHISNIYINQPLYDESTTNKSLVFIPECYVSGSAFKVAQMLIDIDSVAGIPSYTVDDITTYNQTASIKTLTQEYQRYKPAPGYKHAIGLLNGNAEVSYTPVNGRADMYGLSGILSNHTYDELTDTSSIYHFLPVKTGSLYSDSHPADSSYLYKNFISNNGNIATEDSSTFNTSFRIPFTNALSTKGREHRILTSHTVRPEYHVSNMEVYVMARAIDVTGSLTIDLDGTTKHTISLPLSTTGSARAGWSLNGPYPIAGTSNTNYTIETVGSKGGTGDSGLGIQVAGIWIYESPIAGASWSNHGLSSASLGTLTPPASYTGNDNVDPAFVGFFPVLKDGNNSGLSHAGHKVIPGDQLFLKTYKRRCLVADWTHRYYHAKTATKLTSEHPALGAYFNGIVDNVVSVDNLPCTSSAPTGFGIGSLVYKLVVPPTSGANNRVDVWLECAQYVGRNTDGTENVPSAITPRWRFYATSSNGTAATEFGYSNASLAPASSLNMLNELFNIDASGVAGVGSAPALDRVLTGTRNTFTQSVEAIRNKASWWRDTVATDISNYNQAKCPSLVGPFTLPLSSSTKTVIDINAIYDISSTPGVNALLRNGVLVVHGAVFKGYFDPS